MDIVAHNVKFAYNRKTKFATYALNDVSLSVLEGEFFGIIGHTGSGKSTFIQHLNALVPVEEGSLTVGDFDLSPVPGKKKKKDKNYKKKLKSLRRSVGMVFQYPEYQLFAETVFEDVSFAIKNFLEGVTPEECEALVKEAIERVGLDYYAVKDKSPFELSGGQKRRVAIAGVLAAKPDILILDEPCAGLDPVGKTELWQLLHSLHGTVAKTVIIVSHDMNDVADNCTKVAVFFQGTVKKVATPKELFSSPKVIKESGLEVPVTAFLTQALEDEGFKIDTTYTVSNFCQKFKDLIEDKK